MTVKKLTLQGATALLRSLELAVTSKVDPDPRTITGEELANALIELERKGIVGPDFKVTPQSITRFMGNLTSVLEGISNNGCFANCDVDDVCQSMSHALVVSCVENPLELVDCSWMSIEFFSDQNNPDIARIKKTEGNRMATPDEARQCTCSCTDDQGRKSIRKIKGNTQK